MLKIATITMKGIVISICLALTMPLEGQDVKVAPADPQVHLPASFAARLDAQAVNNSVSENSVALPIVLIGPHENEIVVPMESVEDGRVHIAYISPDRITEFSNKNGKLISFPALISELNEKITTIQKLQAANAALQNENEKLWKVAEKSNPQPAPAPVVVQQPTPSGPSKLEQYMLLRSMFPASKPYMLPMPTPPPPIQIPYHAPINCTANTIGTTTTTNCN